MQNALPFLEAVLPAEGLRVVAHRPPRWKKGFKHTFVETNDELVQTCAQLDEAGIQNWFALGTYLDPEGGRTAANTDQFQCLWLDLDYKHYDNIEAADEDIARLIEKVGPPTARVMSGGGLHVYWALRTALPTAQWKPLADAFQATWQSLGIPADPVSADASRVLRLPGTHNRKPEYGEARQVVLQTLDDITYDVDSLTKKLNVGASKPAIPMVVAVPDALRTDDDLGAGIGHRDSFIKPLLTKCKQAQHAFVHQANLSEPQWYAVLGLARHLVDGRKVAHAFSNQHPGYSVQETDAKLAQLERNEVGPTTCEHFKRVNPEGCEGCTFSITSPIVLGYPEVEEVAPTVIVVEHTVSESGEAIVVERQEQPDVTMPEGYKYDGTAIYRRVKDPQTELWRDEEVFRGFLCPERLVVNERNARDTEIQMYVHSRGQPPMRITIPNKAMVDKRDLTRALMSKGVNYMSKDAGHLLDLMQKMVLDVQARRQNSAVADQMGWQDDGMFVVGSTGYRHNATPLFDLPVPPGTKAVVRNYEPAGSLEEWKRTAAIYNHDGAQAYQFALMYGAAGILLPTTKLSGVVLSLYSQSAGRGKSTAGYGALSWWGNPDALKSQSKDTNNALFNKASRHKNLPLLLDEITDKPSYELEDLVYFMSQGREKERLTSEAVARPTLPGWALPVISTSNNSIKSKLQTKRGDTQGLFARIIEVPMDLEFARTMGYSDRMQLRNGFLENYGHAGPKLWAYMRRNWDVYVSMLDTYMAALDKVVEGDPAFRFWVGSCAATLTCATAAKQCGLVSYDVAALAKWTANTIRAQRGDALTSLATPDDILAQFLEVNANRIIVSYERHIGASKSVPAVWPDEGVVGSQLVGRAELPKRSLYISIAAFMRFCHDAGYDLSSFIRNASSTTSGPPLLKKATPGYENLGRGTKTASARTKVLEFDLMHPSLREYASGVDSKITEISHLRSVK